MIPHAPPPGAIGVNVTGTALLAAAMPAASAPIAKNEAVASPFEAEHSSTKVRARRQRCLVAGGWLTLVVFGTVSGSLLALYPDTVIAYLPHGMVSLLTALLIALVLWRRGGEFDGMGKKSIWVTSADKYLWPMMCIMRDIVLKVIAEVICVPVLRLLIGIDSGARRITAHCRAAYERLNTERIALFRKQHKDELFVGVSMAVFITVTGIGVIIIYWLKP